MKIPYRSLLVVALAIPALGAAPLARADAGLLKKHNCIACHNDDRKVVGPAYKDVAKKYKGNKDAAAMLAGKVKKGGQGAWGTIPMPPNPAVPDADIKKMIDYVLAR